MTSVSDKNSSLETEVPTGYRLEPDGVLEIGTIDRPVKISGSYRRWCQKNFGRLIVRSNGETIVRRPDGLILTDDERGQPLAAHHYLDEDDILCFSGLPEDRKLLNQIWALFRELFGSRISE